QLELRRLDRDAARDLLRRGWPGAVADQVADRVHEHATGNPLALLEACSALTDAERAGATPLVELPGPPASLERAMARRLESLPEGAGETLVVAAAADPRDVRAVLLACDALGLEPALLDAAEEAEIVTIEEGRLEFVHPLLRSA